VWEKKALLLVPWSVPSEPTLGLPLEDRYLCQMATGYKEPLKVSERQWARFFSGLTQSSKKSNEKIIWLIP